jgi:MFS family permease
MITDFKTILKNKNFVYLWASQILSQVTIQSMNFLLLTILFAKTGSSIALSFLWVAYTLPSILVGPFASAIVDMVSKRKALIITNLLQAVVIIVYALLHQTSIFFVFGAVFVYSLLNQFYIPAESSTLPSIVPPKNLPQANSLFFLTQQASTIIGFGIAGIIAQAVGFTISLYIYAGLLILAFLSTTLLPHIKANDKIPDEFEKAIVLFFTRIKEGYDYIKSRKNIIAPYIILLTIQTTVAILVVNIPRIASEVLHVAYTSSGIFVMVPAATGAVIGSLFLNRLIKKGWRKKKMIEFFLMMIGVAFLLLTFLVPVLGERTRIVVGVICSLAIGMSGIGIVIPTQTFLQEVTPKEMRARVFGNFWFLSTIVTVLPVIFSGTVTELLGIKYLLFMMSMVGVVGVFISQRYGHHFLENGK